MVSFSLSGGAVGRIHSPNAYAEIEGEESELVTIDTPLAPQRDLIALLKQTTAVPTDHTQISLKSFFIYVDEEQRAGITSKIPEHVLELMNEYQGKDDSMFSYPNFIFEHISRPLLEGREISNFVIKTDFNL